MDAKPKLIPFPLKQYPWRSAAPASGGQRGALAAPADGAHLFNADSAGAGLAGRVPPLPPAAPLVRPVGQPSPSCRPDELVSRVRENISEIMQFENLAVARWLKVQPHNYCAGS